MTRRHAQRGRVSRREVHRHCRSCCERAQGQAECRHQGSPRAGGGSQTAGGHGLQTEGAAHGTCWSARRLCAELGAGTGEWPALLGARGLLREQREAGTSYPDGLGALLLTGSVAALALAIVEGPAWGWASPRVLGALAVAAVTLPLFVLRSARHRAPIIELSLFRVRSFAVAGAGVLGFALGFYALLLANVLFLTSVWGYSVLHAGVALTPGPH